LHLKKLPTEYFCCGLNHAPNGILSYIFVPAIRYFLYLDDRSGILCYTRESECGKSCD
jgi:hypothetical protein